MMKVPILSPSGKKQEIEVPEFFRHEVRQDIIAKVIEAKKHKQPYGPFEWAGKLYSASGKIRHRRHVWKSAYGRGISRVPRKIHWRRGSHFYWIAATIASAVGGRRAHPPKPESMKKKKKINKKELKLAMLSALAATASAEWLRRRYERLRDKKIEVKLPLIISSDVLKLKTKQFLDFLRKTLGPLYEVALKKKAIRAGKGKMRGRKYKSSAGLLLVIASDEKFKASGIEIKPVNELSVTDLAKGNAPGRLTLYTEKAIKELDEKFGK